MSDAERVAFQNRYGLRDIHREVAPSAECALLEVANNGTRYLRFDAWAVEYNAGGAWHRVVLKNWPWFSGSKWDPGRSVTMTVPRPVEVPRDAVWKILFVCCPDGDADARCMVQAETPEIPPIGRDNA
jgi:hypothetical protein